MHRRCLSTIYNVVIQPIALEISFLKKLFLSEKKNYCVLYFHHFYDGKYRFQYTSQQQLIILKKRIMFFYLHFPYNLEKKNVPRKKK